MRRVLTIAAVLALMALAGAGYAAAGKVTLVYKALSGQSARYKSEGTLTFEGGPGPKATMEMKEVEKVSYAEIKPDGTMTMERESESSEATINGQKMPPREDHSKTTIVM